MALALALGAGCSVERGGLRSGTRDSGTDAARDGGRDATPVDAPADRPGDAPIDAPPDAGSDECPVRSWPRPRAVVDGVETGAGFDDPAATRNDVDLDDSGRLVLPLQPHRRGALLLTGYDAAGLEDPPRLGDLGDDTAVGRAFVDDLDQILTGDATPIGLLIEGQDSYSVRGEGEVFFVAGTRSVELAVEDRGVLEVDIPDPGDGSIVTHRATVTDPATPEQITFVVGEDGWYPIRFAYEDEGGDSMFSIRVGPSDGTLEVLPADRMRVDASAIEARELLGWDERAMTATPTGARLDPDPTDVDYGNQPILGLGLTDKESYAVRWLGRMRFDAALGRLRAQTEDAHRVWIDGIYLGGDYLDGSTFDRFMRYALQPGWHDTVIELEEESGNTAQHITWAGATFQPEQMRPRLRFGGRTFARGTDGTLSVSAGATETATLSLAAPSGTPTAVELSAVVETASPGDVDIAFTTPGGVELASLDGSRPLPIREEHAWHRTLGSDRVTAAAGDWTVAIRNDGGAEATVRGAGVLAHYGGVERPHSAMGTFLSAPLDLGDRTTLDRIEADTQVPDGTALRLEARAADDATGLDAAAWTEAGPDGALPAGLEGRFAQLRVTLEGGIDTPRVGALTLVGSRCLCARGTAPAECAPPHAEDALVALYEFDEGSGATVGDLEPEPRLDLTIEDPSAVSWGSGRLSVAAPTRIRTEGGAAALADAVTDAVTIEAWVEPASLTLAQQRPARIVSFSKDDGDRNFTLGQDELWQYVLRLRTDGDGGDNDGFPESHTPAGSLDRELTHVVVTHAGDGTTRIYLDGWIVLEESRPGGLSNWDGSYELVLANETDGGRAWLGTYHRVVLHARALSPDEVALHTDLGP